MDRSPGPDQARIGRGFDRAARAAARSTRTRRASALNRARAMSPRTRSDSNAGSLRKNPATSSASPYFVPRPRCSPGRRCRCCARPIAACGPRLRPPGDCRGPGILRRTPRHPWPCWSADGRSPTRRCRGQRGSPPCVLPLGLVRPADGSRPAPHDECAPRRSPLRPEADESRIVASGALAATRHRGVDRRETGSEVLDGLRLRILRWAGACPRIGCGHRSLLLSLGSDNSNHGRMPNPARCRSASVPVSATLAQGLNRILA